MKIEWKLWVNVAVYLISYFAAGDSLRSSTPTLEQHCDLWEQTHGERVSRWTMSRAIKRLGWTRKKSRMAGDRAQRKGAGRLARERAPASDRIAGFY